MSNIGELTEKCIELVAIAIQLKVENAELRAYKELAQLSLNSESKQALREIAASISAEAGFSKNESYRVPASVLERWAQQLLAL